MMRGPQRGVALITALLVVTLATLAAVAMATRQQLDIRRTGNLLHSEQAYTYLLGAESWARVVLARDLRDSQTDALTEDWATQLPASFVEGGSVIGRIRDAQALFNVNSLAPGGQPDPDAVERYRHLLEALDLPPELADTLLDWIDADMNLTFPDGAEDQTYLLMRPAYRTANRPMGDISELRLIQGYEAEVLDTLRPHVIALPGVTPLNVNTAAAPVLRSVAADVTEADAGNLIEARVNRPQETFNEVGTFLALPELQGKTPPPDAATLSVSSEWFVFEGNAIVGQGRARLATLLHRGADGVQVIQRWREFAALPEPEDSDD